MFIFWYKRCDYCNVLTGHVAREGMELLSVGILKTEDCLGKQLIVVPFFKLEYGYELWQDFEFLSITCACALLLR